MAPLLSRVPCALRDAQALSKGRVNRTQRRPAIACSSSSSSSSSGSGPQIPAQASKWVHSIAGVVAIGVCLSGGAYCPSAYGGEVPQFSGVDDSESALVQGLLKKSAEKKADYDKERLENYYNKQFNINKIAESIGIEQKVLPEPCDPRDPEFTTKCTRLPRLPQDRADPDAYRPPPNAPRVGNLLGGFDPEE